MPNLRLLTIPISHYCEKARWALDRLGLPYVEERHLQVFHYLRSYPLSGGPNVPVLTDGDTTVTDSTAILQYLDRYAPPELRLYPEQDLDAIEEWEELFDETLGIESRRWVYFHAMQTPQLALRTSSQGVPGWQAAVAPFCYPLLKAYITRHLSVSAERVHSGLENSRRLIARVDATLSDGRSYLVGDRFTAADLTLASMMAPFLMPPEYGVRLPQPDEVSEAMRVIHEEMRDTCTGQYVMHLYRSHRQSQASDVASSNRANSGTDPIAAPGLQQ
jgi:glutathione S-transferase